MVPVQEPAPEKVFASVVALLQNAEKLFRRCFSWATVCVIRVRRTTTAKNQRASTLLNALTNGFP